MKKIIIPFLLILTAIYSCSKDIDDQPKKKLAFYHNGDSLIYLQFNYQSICIAFKQEEYNQANTLSLLQNFQNIDLSKTEVGNYYRIFATLKSDLSETEYFKLLNDLNLQESVEYATPGFISGSYQLFLTNKFFIKSNMPASSFNNFLSQNSLRFSKVENYTPGILYIVNKMASGFEALDLSNEINDYDGIEYSEPDFTHLGNFLSK